MWKFKKPGYNNPFFGNIGKKTLAVIIAISLWIVANLEFDIERNINIPIHFVNLKNDLVIVNKPPEKINLRMRGPRSKLSSFATSNISINYDLQDFKDGKRKINIRRDDVDVPREVQLITISPVEIDLEIDKLVSKKVEIIPLIDNPDKGYEIVDTPKIEPSKVLLKGPEQVLNKLNEVYTTKISLEGEKSNFTIQVPLQLPSPLIQLPDNQLVKVTIDINEIVLIKEFKEVEIILKNFEDKKYEIISELKVDLIFEGPYNLINSLKSEDLEIFIDAINIKNKKLNKLDINVIYPNPESIKLTKISPEKIRIIFY